MLLVKDSFEFCKVLRDFGPVQEISFMCSFDVKSLCTNVPIDETIEICLDTLYRLDIQPPDIEETLLKKLLLTATRDVEFSFNNRMYRQIDGVAMGSPSGQFWLFFSWGTVSPAFLKSCCRKSTEGLWMTHFPSFFIRTKPLNCWNVWTVNIHR